LSDVLTLDNSKNALFAGTVLIKDKLKFTQDDGNEKIDSADDGYMDYYATTQHRFNNDVEISGDLLFGSSDKKKLQLRPNLIQSQAKVSSNKPTEVQRGCNIGHSFPIYNDDDEELFFRMRIPLRWDGTTDPQVGVMVTITGAEDVGDKFKFQLEWQTTVCGGDTVMGTTTSNVTSEQTIVTGGGTAHTAYCIFFNLDASDATNPIVAGEMLQGRLRRIAATANEVSNEIAVWDWATSWAVDKAFGDWSVEENVSD
jgi:hypothetical protein